MACSVPTSVRPEGIASLPRLHDLYTDTSVGPWPLGLEEKKKERDCSFMQNAKGLIRVEFLEKIGGGLWMELALGEGRKCRLEKQS